MTQNRIILDLCGGTGSWSEPYRKAGYDVRVIDVDRGSDVRLMKLFPGTVHGILAAPPCTHLSVSGARWWNEKGESALLEALSIVDACLRVIRVNQPQWWALENPTGRLGHYLGTPQFGFDPCDFAGYSDGENDTYTKKTWLWGSFNVPVARRKEPTDARIHTMPPGPERSKLRSITPPSFAQAFFEANP